MMASVILVASTLFGCAVATDPIDENQLETARLTQAAQRVEFGVEGDESAFKLRFSDPVRQLVFS
jgi:hypothetical protein